MKEQSIKKNIALSTVYQILLLITPLLTTPYIARVLGPQGNGIYSYANSYQMYFSMFAALGTVSYGRREIARNRTDEKIRSKLFWEIELLTCITTCICIVFWVPFALLQSSYKTIYLILTLNLLNTLFDISWFYAGIEQFQYTVSLNALFRVLGVILQLVLVKKETDIALYVFIICVTTLLGTLSMWLILPKFLVRVSVKELRIKAHFKETLIYFIPTIATSIYTVLDKTLIGLITLDQRENGYYEQTTKIINMMKALTFTSLNIVLGSRISYLFAEEKYDEIKMRIAKSIEYILFIGIGMCFGLIAIADRFVLWFLGNEYLPVIPLLRIFSPIVIIIGISNCLGTQYYTPAGLRKQSAVYIIVGALVNLGMNFVLIPRYAGIGAAIASIIAESVITILYIRNCNSYLDKGIIWNKSWKKILSGVLMLIVVLMVGKLPIGNLTSIIIQLLVGLSIYMLVLFILKDEFMNSIIKQIRKIMCMKN